MYLGDGWHKTDRSNPSGNCVKARVRHGVGQIGDTKLPSSAPVLTGGLAALTHSIRTGQL